MSYAEITLKSGARIEFDCISLKWERSPIRTGMSWELPEGASRRPVFFDVDEIAAAVFVDTSEGQP